MILPSELKSLFHEIRKIFKNAHVNAADMEARIVIEERTGCKFSDIVTQPDLHVDDSVLSNISTDLEQRLAGVPLTRIYGENEFWGRRFKVTENTLDPRNDTETIIARALEIFPKNKTLRILDLGTGTGCILITLLCEFPNAIGVGVDICDEALACAKDNANALNVMDRAEFLCGEWFEPVLGQFDLIVSNPPYIVSDVIPSLSPEVKNHDPILALDGGKDGLDAYKIIFSKIKNFLNDDGIGLFEIGFDQADDVMRLSEDAGFAQRIVHMDMAGNPRVVEISNGDK